MGPSWSAECAQTEFVHPIRNHGCMARKLTPSSGESPADLALPVQPHWYKDAVIYQLHVRSFFDSDGDGIGDFRGPDRKARLPARPGRYGPVAAAVLSIAAARRWLRHRELHRGQSVVRQLARLQGVPARSARSRTARDHRTGAQPHLRSASLVSAGAAGEAGASGARFLRLERHARAVSGCANHLQGLRSLELGVGSGGQGLLLAPLLFASARSELRKPERCARADARGARLLVAAGRRRPAARRGALSATSAKARTARTCRKRTSF